ncbi:hypothetical protein NP493_63g02027 [Ridgeia piscesae]|uniref:Ionotropic glutamate receptor C-terminal domain-containing protein n=1 Tax=Ridgeia piscesae TaxID=27915 RepID=A0AAD9PAJ8_RIDPI|nr:hypothetical protein NP493_63g02027 [Ridgeia piscesae]
MVACWWFFVILVAATYTGNLIAVLAVSKTGYPVQSLRELAEQSTYKYGTTAGAAIYNLMGKSTVDVYQKLWQRSLQHDENNVKSWSEVIKKLEKGNYIYLGETTLLNTVSYTDCRFIVAKETFFPSSFAFVVPENSPYLPAFNNIINNLLETGLIERWRAQYYPRDVCSSIRESEMSVPDPATVKATLGAFVLIFVGIVLAMLVLVFEVKFNLISILKFILSYLKRKLINWYIKL